MTTVYFVGGLLCLFLGGEGLVRGAAALGLRMGMSPLVSGLTIIAFATSAPELAVSLDATLRGVPNLAVGNVVGSNICNIALILGITALLKPPRLREYVIRHDVLVMILCTLIVSALLLDQQLGRTEGGLLTASVAIYVSLTVWHARSTRHRRRPASRVPLLSEALWVNFAITAGSIAVLVIGSDLFVLASIDVATALGISTAVIGLTAAAFATSLPELVTCIIAARHNEPEMAAGNLIGSNIFNLLLILGATSLVRPLSSDGVGVIDLAVMVAVSLLALAFMMTKQRVERFEGIILIVIYGTYMAWLFSSAT